MQSQDDLIELVDYVRKYVQSLAVPTRAPLRCPLKGKGSTNRWCLNACCCTSAPVRPSRAFVAAWRCRRPRPFCLQGFVTNLIRSVFPEYDARDSCRCNNHIN
jgi:hypothetical protein